MVAVKFEANGNKGVVNLVKTGFGRGDAHYLRQGQNSALRYVNRQKSRRWFPTSGADSLFDSNADGSRILTEEDLVKLKSEFPGFYQDRGGVRGSFSPSKRTITLTPVLRQ